MEFPPDSEVCKWEAEKILVPFGKRDLEAARSCLAAACMLDCHFAGSGAVVGKSEQMSFELTSSHFAVSACPVSCKSDEPHACCQGS